MPFHISAVRGLATLMALLSASATAVAQSSPPKTIYVAGYGGTFERMMRDIVIPRFETANNAKVEYVVGTTGATLAKLQAQKNAQEIDVAILDWGPMLQADQFGFCDTVSPSAQVDAVIDQAKPIKGKAVGIFIGSAAPIYNEATFKQLNLPVPTSWADLRRPEYKGQLSLAHISTTTGTDGFVMVNRALGGSEANVDQAFAVFAKEIRGNIVTFSPSAPKLEELLQRNEIALTVLSRTRTLSLQKRGLPIRIADVKEGAIANLNMVCPVVNSDVPELAQAFIRHMVSDEVQLGVASVGFIPVTKTVKLTPEIEAINPLKQTDIDRLVWSDWKTINANRPAWIQRWNREVER